MRGLLAVLCLCSTAAADTALVDFDTLDVAALTATDAKASLSHRSGRAALSIVTGDANQWPGVGFPAPRGRWDLSASEYVAADVRNLGDAPVVVKCRVDNPGADGVARCVYGSVSLKAGEAGTIRAALVRSTPLRDKLFGMRGSPLGPDGASIDPANVVRLIVFADNPGGGRAWEISAIRAGGHYLEPGADFFPIIDPFGQYAHRDWPGKTHSTDELRDRRDREAEALRRDPGPADWDAWGGDASGPNLKATGFFRVEKYRGKWWMVDPGGKLFFSHGIDCVAARDPTAIEEREGFFADFPGDKPDFAEFVSRRACLLGHYAGKKPRCFDFAGSNLKRKYGNDWAAKTPAVVQRRLRSWGLNTIGAWSDLGVARRHGPAYVAIVNYYSRRIEGSNGYWGKFPDPFDPAFAIAVQEAVNKAAGETAQDPWCMGYFVDNELGWGDETSLAVAALKSPLGQPAKTAFVMDLKLKYGSIDALNRAWGASTISWDALLADRAAPDAKKAGDDLRGFYTHAAETYFLTIRQTIRRAAPHQLYLGCRFADGANPRAEAAAARFCDVVSFNVYRKSLDGFVPGGGDVPLIVGEFHFGALDRGLFHPGLVPVADQAARAKAYKEYVNSAVDNPRFVGCHWFKYQDEPTTGRVWDEENYQIGFVDVADAPYAETTAAARAAGAVMYKRRLGE